MQRYKDFCKTDANQGKNILKNRQELHTLLQVPDWQTIRNCKDYSCFAECGTVATYPIAKQTARNLLEYPRRNETFRLDIQFKNKDEARKCFADTVR